MKQSFEDFEVIIVDDGADAATQSAIAQFQDPRLQVIRQANDGLSAARNRGLRVAKGKYACFLDGDDCRPTWSFKSVAQVLTEHWPEAHFTAGVLSEIRGEILPFYDAPIFSMIHDKAQGLIDKHHPEFKTLLPMMMLIEPQSANKFVSRHLVQRAGLVFPNGHFFEDMLFHSALIASALSFTISQDPSFTYFRRYGRAQITASASDTRLDAISVAKMSLENFAESARFSNVLLRGALTISLFRLLKWCEECTSHVHRYQYHEALLYLVSTMNPGYLESLEPYRASGLPHADVIQFINGIVNEARQRI